MLAMADRLFNDFDNLPVKEVFDAISSARRRLRLEQSPATPEAIERLARGRLHGVAAADHRTMLAPPTGRPGWRLSRAVDATARTGGLRAWPLRSS